MDKDRLQYLIQKQRLGDITPAERDELEAFWYLAQNDETRFKRLSAEEMEFARQVMYDGIKARIDFGNKAEKAAVRSLSTPAQWLLKIAASVAVVIALSVFWTDTPPPDQEFHTAYGEQMTIELPDQSTVVLNGNSTLRFSPSWSPKLHREVWIEGEAYFDVIHTLNHQKFIVHTKNEMDVQVLGTKFNVKAWGGKTQVMLQEGSVRLEVGVDQATESITMEPGELATLHNDTLTKTTVRPEEYVSWTENKLFFDQTALRDVAEILKHTYGMTVAFEEESLADRKLSGEISVVQVEDILKAITASMGVEISRVGDSVTFYKQPVEEDLNQN